MLIKLFPRQFCHYFLFPAVPFFLEDCISHTHVGFFSGYQIPLRQVLLSFCNICQSFFVVVVSLSNLQMVMFACLCSAPQTPMLVPRVLLCACMQAPSIYQTQTI